MITNFKIERIRQLQKEGLTATQIAKEVGVTPKTVYKYVDRSSDSNIRNYVRDLTQETVDRIRQLRTGGLTYESIADKVGVSEGTAFRHSCLIETPQYSLRQDKNDRIRQLHTEGLSGSSIAKEVGASLNAVYKIIGRSFLSSPGESTHSVRVNAAASKERIGHIQQLRTEGLPLESIADKVGVSIRMVRKHTRLITSVMSPVTAS